MRRAWLMMGVAWMAQALVVDPIAFASDARPETTMWYTQPAAKWEEALPVGNGRLGAMVFGGAGEERLQLNEDSLWSGGPQDADNPAALGALPEVRRLLFDGRYVEGEALAEKLMVCKGPGPGRSKAARLAFGWYQTLGDLRVQLDHGEQVKEYRRSLDLRTAVAQVRYRAGEATIVREVLASHPHQAIVLRLQSDRPGQLAFNVSLDRPELSTTVPV